MYHVIQSKRYIFDVYQIFPTYIDGISILRSHLHQFLIVCIPQERVLFSNTLLGEIIYSEYYICLEWSNNPTEQLVVGRYRI